MAMGVLEKKVTLKARKRFTSDIPLPSCHDAICIHAGVVQIQA